MPHEPGSTAENVLRGQVVPTVTPNLPYMEVSIMEPATGLLAWYVHASTDSKAHTDCTHSNHGLMLFLHTAPPYVVSYPSILPCILMTPVLPLLAPITSCLDVATQDVICGSVTYALVCDINLKMGLPLGCCTT